MTLQRLARSAASRALRTYRTSPARWYIHNARAKLDYRLRRPALDPVSQGIVDELDCNGIATTRVDALVDPAVTHALHEEIARREHLVHDSLSVARDGSGPDNHKARYRFHLLGDFPPWEADSAFAQFALSPGIRAVVDAYFGLEAKLRYYNVWRTFPRANPPSDSQLWHRDREDRLILKAFLYLDDVGDDAGPLWYIPESHAKGRLRIEPEAFREPGHSNLRSRDHQMEAVVPRSRWYSATGPRGTLLFVDTAGYHKGGHSLTKERHVFTSMFTSPAANDGDLFVTTRGHLNLSSDMK